VYKPSGQDKKGSVFLVLQKRGERTLPAKTCHCLSEGCRLRFEGKSVTYLKGILKVFLAKMYFQVEKWKLFCVQMK
jgi:hypothetical protein